MRKASVALVATMFALLWMSVPAAATPASEAAPLRGVIDMAYGLPCPVVTPVPVPDPAACWYGTVTGDINGTVAFWETAANYVVGTTEHFFEVFTILPVGGGSIYGVDAGVWNFSTFKFRSQGWVTDASSEWASLIGLKYFEMGRTSDPNLGLPVTGYDTEMFLAEA